MTAATIATDRGRKAGMGVLLAACISTLIVNANTSAVSILLPAISEDTGSPIDTLQWAVTGYSLVGAAVIVTSGVLGDVFGRRKLFLLGLGLFIVSSILIALSQNGAGVIAGRFIQGAAGSTILASGLSLLSVASSGEEQMRAISLWGAASAIGAAIGPLIGGVLVDSVGWQGLFWINAAIAVALVPVTLQTIQESNDPTKSRSIDYAGTALVAAVLVPLILGMSKGTDWGWGSPATISCFVLSAVAVAGFVWVEGRVTAPLIDLRLMRNTVLVASTVAILIGAGTINAMGYLLSIYFQDPASLDMTPLQAGAATLPATIGLVAVTPFIPRLATKIGSRQTVVVGFIIMTIGFVGLAFVQASWVYLAFVLPVLAVAIGMGLSNGAATAAATSSVDEQEVGAASGISNMARYVGAAVAVAAAASMYGGIATNRVEAGHPPDEALATGFAAAAIMLAVVSAAGILLGPIVRHQQKSARAIDSAAAAAAHLHTIAPPPDTATGAPAA